MKKIKTLFKLNKETHLVDNDVVDGSEWVINGEGIATEKFDGTSCRIKNGKLYKRYDRTLPKDLSIKLKKNLYSPKIEDFKTPPDGFEECDNSAMAKGHIFGWVPIDVNDPANQWHIEAFNNLKDKEDGTYELLGPKIQGNHYNLDQHELWKHGSKTLLDIPRNYDGLKEYLSNVDFEGIVWHHPDTRMVKIRREDFFKSSQR